MITSGKVIPKLKQDKQVVITDEQIKRLSRIVDKLLDDINEMSDSGMCTVKLSREYVSLSNLYDELYREQHK